MAADNAPRFPLPAWLEWPAAGLLACNIIWTTLCLGGYRPETMVVTSALTGGLLFFHCAARAWLGQAVAPWHPAGWLFIPFLLYAAANVLWVTPVRWLGWHDWLWWAQLVAVFWVVLNDIGRPWVRQFILGSLAAVGFVAVVLAAYQAFVRPEWLMMGRVQAEQFIGRSSGPFGIPNSLAALLLLLLPPAVMLTCQRRAGPIQRVLAGYLAAAYLLGLVLTVSRGAWLGLAVAGMLWPLLMPGRTWIRRLKLAAVTVGGVLMVGAALYWAAPAMRERFDTLVAESGERTRPVMWRGAWQLFRENPLWGSGAGSYNIAFEKHRPEPYQLDSQWAHNDYLNTLSDYGVAGFGLFFGACAWVALRCVYRGRPFSIRQVGGEWLEDPYFRQAVALGLLAFGFQLFVDFHLKIPALALALATVAGLLVRQMWPAWARGAAARGSLSRALALAAAAGVAGGMGLGVMPHYRAEAARYAARQSLDTLAERETGAYREVVEPAREALIRAVSLNPGNAQAWADLAYATSLQAHGEPGRTRQLGEEAEQQAGRALALAPAVPEFHIRQGVALDMQGRWLEAGNCFAQALRLAPASARVWYYQAYHLSLDASAQGRARSAVAISLRLDPGYAPAQRLRQQLATGR